MKKLLMLALTTASFNIYAADINLLCKGSLISALKIEIPKLEEYETEFLLNVDTVKNVALFRKSKPYGEINFDWGCSILPSEDFRKVCGYSAPIKVIISDNEILHSYKDETLNNFREFKLNRFSGLFNSKSSINTAHKSRRELQGEFICSVVDKKF
jgi:hypothetical protein